LAAQRGWTVHEVYSDHSLSAWKKNVRRPAWEKMLADVEAGKINAIIAYHGDRLYRQPRDLEKLIDLAEVKGISLASSLGAFDLGTSQGRIFARMHAVVSEGESARHSERKKAQYDRWRRNGRTRPGGGGGRCFGFEADGVTHRKDEAQAIRDVTADVI